VAHYRRILITGAAGLLGEQLRRGLATVAERLRLTDRHPLGAAAPHEEIVACELADFDAVLSAMRGVDAVVHFGGASRENPFEVVLQSSIRGSFNIYEAARQSGVKRIVYASSIHAVGFYPREEVIDSAVAHRPDSVYGLSKCFGEDLARLYFDKFGLESVCLRICSSFERPADRRMLGTWMSFADCVAMVERALLTPRVGFSIAYGVSNNREASVSNRLASHLGYVAQDSADDYRAEVEAQDPPGDPQRPAVKFVGGAFCEFAIEVAGPERANADKKK
jgi:uronate dehydrogenase